MFNSQFVRKNFIYLALSAFSFSTSFVIFLISLDMQGWTNLISLLAYVFGIIYGVIAALKLKEHNENPDKMPLFNPMVFMFIAATLMALPTFLSTGSGCSGFTNLSSRA